MEIANETLPKSIEAKEFSAFFSVGIVMLLVLTFYLSGCSGKNEVQDQTNGGDTIPNQSASAEEPSSILYVNHQLGFSMEMPLNWMGQVEVEEEYGLHHQNGGNCITFYHKPTHDNGEGRHSFLLLTATPANGARTTRRSLQGTALSSRKQKRIPICSEHRVMSNIANQILCWQKPISLLLHSKTLLSPISMQPVRP